MVDKIKIFIKYFLYIVYRTLKSSYYDIIYYRYRKKYKIAKTFRFNGENIFLYGDGEIILGENSYIGDYSTIQAVKGQKVIIGNNCAISHNVRIYTSNYNADDIINNVYPNSYKRGDVIIGDNCWIGVNVFIKEGVKIGNNVIIGGGSIVVKDIPSNTIVSGVPAKIIKQRKGAVH